MPVLSQFILLVQVVSFRQLLGCLLFFLDLLILSLPKYFFVISSRHEKNLDSFEKVPVGSYWLEEKHPNQGQISFKAPNSTH